MKHMEDFVMPNYNYGKEIYDIELDKIDSSTAYNSRGEITPKSVWELAESIANVGLQEPILVMEYPIPIQKEKGKEFRLIAGFRRFKAHQINMAKTIKSIISAPMTEVEARIINLCENLSRQDLNILEEAKSLKHLIELGMTEDSIAKKIGKARGWVQNRKMLLFLPKEVQEIAASGLLTIANIRDLYSYNSSAEQLAEAIRIKGLKEKGLKGVVVKKPDKGSKRPKSNIKKNRTPKEIKNLVRYFAENNMYGLHTVCLAWCTGGVSDKELIEAIQEYAIEHDMDYIIPEKGFIPDMKGGDEYDIPEPDPNEYNDPRDYGETESIDTE
jgi:ParB family chromosome partitioning protein